MSVWHSQENRNHSANFKQAEFNPEKRGFYSCWRGYKSKGKTKGHWMSKRKVILRNCHTLILEPTSLQLLPYFRDFVTFGFGSTPKTAEATRAMMSTGVLPLLGLQESKLILFLLSPQDDLQQLSYLYREKTDISLFFCLVISYCYFLLAVPGESP